jgi:hypothetical protein
VSDLPRGPYVERSEIEEIARPPRWIVRAAWVGYVVLIVALVFALSACSTVPRCPSVPITLIGTPLGPLYVLDSDGISALRDVLRRLESGECRLGPAEIEQPAESGAAGRTM